MTDVRVTPLEPGAYGVEIDEGGLTTGHRVLVPDAFWDDRGIGEVDDAIAVREAVQFLLARGPSTSVPAEISLVEVAQSHADFVDELQSRLAHVTA